MAGNPLEAERSRYQRLPDWVDEAVLNLSGGERRIAQEAGQVALQAEFDLQKSLASKAHGS
jgi:hypothetical protein